MLLPDSYPTPQVFCGSERPSESAFDTVSNRDPIERELSGERFETPFPQEKPFGGFWTCSPGGLSWRSELNRGRFASLYKNHDSLGVWEVEPNPAQELYVVDSEDSLDAISEEVGFAMQEWRIDYEALAEDYDGLWLTEDGWDEVRYRADGMELGSWDVPSTVWFTFEMLSIERVNSVDLGG